MNCFYMRTNIHIFVHVNTNEPFSPFVPFDSCWKTASRASAANDATNDGANMWLVRSSFASLFTSPFGMTRRICDWYAHHSPCYSPHHLRECVNAVLDFKHTDPHPPCVIGRLNSATPHSSTFFLFFSSFLSSIQRLVSCIIWKHNLRSKLIKISATRH